MKKYNCLLVLLVFVFLLLCACASAQTDQASTGSDTPSSPPSSVPATSAPDTSTPTTSTPATSIPDTSIPTTSTVPITAPPFQPSTDWVTDREIVPFEDRFKEDVPFGNYPTTWFAPVKGAYSAYSDYAEYHLAISSPYASQPIIIQECGLEEDSWVYYVPIQKELLADFDLLAADGRWAYLCSDDELCKLDLLNGDLTTLTKKSAGDICWEVHACGKDTVCIFRLDAEKNLRVFYRDLHSNAEKTLYEGILPESSPYDLKSEMRGIYFSAPSSTLGTFSWQMMNPAFYAVVQKELENPESPFQHHYQENYYSKCWEDPENYPIHLGTWPGLCEAIQEAYDTPYHVKYICDPVSGIVTEDYGIIDSCFYGTGQGCNHFDYEITKEETPEILDVAPVEIPNIGKPSGEWPDVDSLRTYVYSEFGYGYPLLRTDASINKLADIPVTEAECGSDFVYCITAEGTIVQISYDEKICNTIYTSENTLDDLFYWQDNLYFIDGTTIVCIDTVAGTYRPILRTTLKELFINGENEGDLFFGIRQGLYCQKYLFNPDTGVLEEEESYI